MGAWLNRGSESKLDLLSGETPHSSSDSSQEIRWYI